MARRRWTKSEVQAVRFPKSRYTKAQAKAWAKRNGYKYGHVEELKNFWSLRQFKPIRGREKRTVEFGKGITAVVSGRPKRKRNPRKLADGGPGRRGSVRVVELLGYVHNLAYQHAEDGQFYEHDFETEPALYALAGGGLLIEGDRKLWIED